MEKTNIKENTLNKNFKDNLLPLSYFCDVYDGTHQTPKYTHKGIPFVSVENIQDLENTSKYISKKDFDKFYPIKPNKNDILLTRIGDIGTPALIDKEYDLAFYVSLALIKIRTKEILPLYLFYFIQTPFFRKELWKRTIHNAFPIKINKNEISKCKIKVLSLTHQELIAKTLYTLDKKIKGNCELLNILKKYKKGIINLWFKNIGKTAKLIELVKQQTSQLLTHQIKDNFGVYPVYDATGKIYKFVDFYMNSNDSIAIIKYGSGCGRTFIACDKHSVLGTMSELIPLNPHDLTYIFAFTESTKFKKLCKKYIEVGTTPNLYYSDYSTVAVYYPDERKIFVKLIDLINKKCNNLEKERENLYKFKRKLLKDMFI